PRMGPRSGRGRRAPASTSSRRAGVPAPSIGRRTPGPSCDGVQEMGGAINGYWPLAEFLRERLQSLALESFAAALVQLLQATCGRPPAADVVDHRRRVGPRPELLQ